MKNSRDTRSWRRMLAGAGLAAWVVITTTYVVVVAVTEGAGSAITPAMAAIGGGICWAVFAARVWGH